MIAALAAVLIAHQGAAASAAVPWKLVFVVRQRSETGVFWDTSAANSKLVAATRLLNDTNALSATGVWKAREERTFYSNVWFATTSIPTPIGPDWRVPTLEEFQAAWAARGEPTQDPEPHRLEQYSAHELPVGRDPSKAQSQTTYWYHCLQPTAWYVQASTSAEALAKVQADIIDGVIYKPPAGLKDVDFVFAQWKVRDAKAAVAAATPETLDAKTAELAQAQAELDALGVPFFNWDVFRKMACYPDDRGMYAQLPRGWEFLATSPATIIARPGYR